MSEITLSVLEDNFEARINIVSSANSFPSKEDVKNALTEEGIVYGINHDLLNELVNKKNPVENEIIAQGKIPKPGVSAELVWQIEIDYSTKPAITDSDKADFKRLKLFERVQKDQILVSKLPATAGSAGKNVLGEEVVAKSEDVKFPAGKNTKISEDGLTLFSTIDGYAYWENELLCIDNVYQIDGNVDYHTGNIRANGTVVINGDVRSGFRVEATESIIIKGNVEAASIYSQNGDIKIECGILGAGRAKILAGGNLYCGFIQDATISVKGNIEVDHYVINSKISSGGKVKLESNEGLIRGGIISSGTGISAIEVGSNQKIYTELNIRLGDSLKESSQSWDIGRKRKELYTKLDNFEKRVSFLRLLQQRVEDLSDDKNQELGETLNKIEELRKEIEDLKKQDLEIRKAATQEIKRNEILIAKKLYTNVSIDFGGIDYYSNESIEKIKIFREDNEIIIESLT